jgi:uncharacterized membrane protein (UPF0127 family)
MADKLLTRRRIAIASLLLIPIAVASVIVLMACGRVIKDDKYADVLIDGRKFHLELALEPDVRFKGLSGRTEIPSDGGMLFAFPFPVTTAFVMRDCPIPIDIIFLDGSGRVVATHKMTVEAPRTDAEKKLNEQGINEEYETRLKKYPSNFAAQFAIELKGNTLDAIKVRKSDKIELDVADLKKRAK